jgi:hypothetical protein
MEGQLSRHPLAELIREITESELSGVLRLSREAARVAGLLRFRPTSLCSVEFTRAPAARDLKRQNIKSWHLENAPATATDEELSQRLIASGDLKPEELQKARSGQALDVLRTALLWTEGDWQFNQKVRIPLNCG